MQGEWKRFQGKYDSTEGEVDNIFPRKKRSRENGRLRGSEAFLWAVASVGEGVSPRRRSKLWRATHLGVTSRSVQTCQALGRSSTIHRLGTLIASVNEAPAWSTPRGTELAAKLRTEYPRMFDPKYKPEWELYADGIMFEDPLTRLRGIQAYRRNIEFLRQSPVFGEGQLVLHDVIQYEPNGLLTRWTLSLRAKFVPFQPLVIFTGTSTYTWSPEDGRIVSHIDRWDSISRQEYFSPEGLRDLLAQLFFRPFRNLQGTVLYRFRNFMIVQQQDGTVVAQPVYRQLQTSELERMLEQSLSVHGYRAVEAERTIYLPGASLGLRLHKVDVSRKP